MRDGDIRHLAVLDGDRLVGLLSNRDYRRVLERADASGTIRGVSSITVGEIMTPVSSLITGRPDMPLLTVAQLMVTRKIGCLPVVDEAHHLVGLLTQKDVLRWLAGQRLT
jgi:CBS domain-containing protein